MENSNLAVALKFRWSFKTYKVLMLHVRGFAQMFPEKEEKYLILMFLLCTMIHIKREDVRSEEK